MSTWLYLILISFFAAMFLRSILLHTVWEPDKQKWMKKFVKANHECEKWKEKHSKALVKGKSADSIHHAYCEWVSAVEQTKELEAIGYENNYIS